MLRPPWKYVVAGYGDTKFAAQIEFGASLEVRYIAVGDVGAVQEACVRNRVAKARSRKGVTPKLFSLPGTASVQLERLLRSRRISGDQVLTANQVAFWYALRQAGVHAAVNGYGRVFTK